MSNSRFWFKLFHSRYKFCSENWNSLLQHKRIVLQQGQVVVSLVRKAQGRHLGAIRQNRLGVSQTDSLYALFTNKVNGRTFYVDLAKVKLG